MPFTIPEIARLDVQRHRTITCAAVSLQAHPHHRPFGTSMPDATATSAGNTSYGKYLLVRKLAAGGMGEIFLAKQQGPAGFEKLLVVKKILAHLKQNREFVELFIGEARLAARMSHRNIVQVFELGEQDGSYFIAMEYVHGKTLREVVDTARRK